MSSIQGYKMKEYSMPTKRYCQTLSLKNNPILIEEYIGKDIARRKHGPKS